MKTQMTMTYNFMDLLKDHGAVPELATKTLGERLKALFVQVEAPEFEYDYDFMDLMQSKGYVPQHCNDNDLWSNAM
tara:strand:- start:2678 stop:2905 length:228 start_codon:yes stop_codon:yes gene_type:complete